MSEISNPGESLSIGDIIGDATEGSIFFAGVGGILAEDNANLFWDDTNDRLGIGNNSPDSAIHLAGTTSADVRIEAQAASASAIVAPHLSFKRSRGTIASPEAISDGDLIFVMSARGHDGTSFSSNSTFFGVATEDWSGTNRGHTLRFSNIPNGGINETIRLVIGNDGRVGIGGDTTPDARLDIQSSADEIQLLVTGHSTQTSDSFVIEKSDGTDVFVVEDSGETTIGDGTAGDSDIYFFDNGVHVFTVGNDDTADRLVIASGVLDTTNDLMRFTASQVTSVQTMVSQEGRIVNTTRVTTTYTILETDHAIACDTDGGAFTITLPAGVAGTEYKISNTGTAVNDLTVAPDGAELLIGVNSNFTLADGESLHLIYDATEGWS